MAQEMGRLRQAAHCLIACNWRQRKGLDLVHVNVFNASSWESTFERDFWVLSTASDLVRHNLGLGAAAG
jgi:hypothetical protein